VKCRGRRSLCRGVELSKAWFSKRDDFGKNYFSLTIEQSFLQVVNGKESDGAERHMVIRHQVLRHVETDTVMDVAACLPSVPRSPALIHLGLRRNAFDCEEFAETPKAPRGVRFHAVAEIL